MADYDGSNASANLMIEALNLVLWPLGLKLQYEIEDHLASSIINITYNSNPIAKIVVVGTKFTLIFLRSSVSWAFFGIQDLFHLIINSLTAKGFKNEGSRQTSDPEELK